MDVSKLLEKAGEAADRRNYDYAIELYLQACRLDPNNVQARRSLRAVENRMAKEKGASFWGKTKTLGLQGQLRTSYLTKKYDSAMEKAEEILRIDPGNIGVLMLLGKAAALAGHKAAAIGTFEDVIAMNAGGSAKHLIECSRELGRLYEEEGRIKDALAVWENVSKHVPGDREATIKYRDLSARDMHAIIETAALSGKRGSAARSTQTTEQIRMQQLLDLDKGEIKTAADLQIVIEATLNDIQKRPDDARLWGKLGDLHKQGNNYPDAKKAYETARQKDASNYTWPFKLDDLEIQKMLQGLKALAPQVKALTAGAREEYQKRRLEYLDYRLKSYLEREKQYSTDSRIKFELGSTFFDLAVQRKDKALYDEAIKRFQATYHDPKYRVDSGLKLGMGFVAKGQYDLALRRLDETLAAIPKEIRDDRWKDLMYSKGDALYKSGQREEARKAFLDIYEVDVAYKDVSKRIEDLVQAAQPPQDQQAQA